MTKFYYRGWVGFTQPLVAGLNDLLLESEAQVFGPLGHGIAQVGMKGIKLSTDKDLWVVRSTFIVHPAVNHSEDGIVETYSPGATALVGAMLMLLNETTEHKFKISAEQWSADFHAGDLLFQETFGRMADFQVVSRKG